MSNVFDFSPLFRTAIGLERLLAAAQDTASPPSYPPYNIEKTGEDSYRLTMAVAGFAPGDIEITLQDGNLTVTGRAEQKDDEREFLYRGIAARSFERRFVLADHIVVEGADLRNGLLEVALKRVVPEARKPRRIEIGSAPRMVGNRAAA